MANPSIFAAFERMWQHIVLALGGKADKTDIAQSDMNQNDESAPDYVKNKTHWVEENVNIELCDHDALEITDECVDVDITEPFIIGQSYTIIVNGTTYNLTARYYPIWQCFMIGNDLYYDVGESDGIDSDVPFCIAWYWPDDTGVELYAPIGTYSINISTIRNIYHKLDEGFLPTTIVGRQVSEDGAEIFNDYYKNRATGYMSHAEGETTTASGAWSHAEGNYTFANGNMSHTEGYGTIAEKQTSHAEGHETYAYDGSHAEGLSSKALGDTSHTEGNETTAYGDYSHAEGSCKRDYYSCEVTGAAGSVTYNISSWSTNYLKTGRIIWCIDTHTWAKIISVSESESTVTLDQTLDKTNPLDNARIRVLFGGAHGEASHSEGKSTSAHSDYQHVQGKYNVEDFDGKYAHIVGNGTAVNKLSNAHTLDWSGNAWFAGEIKVGGTGQDDTTAKTLATTEYIDNKFSTSNLNTLTVGNATKAGTASSLDATGVAQVKAIKVDDATTADKVAQSLKIGAKTYNGSSEQTITAGDLGLESAIRFVGMTSTAITDGGTQSPVVDGETHIPIRGDVVIRSSTDQEFIWNGSAWEELGNSSSHALKSITISAGTGLTGGGTLEANRTISLATSGATAGTYGAASSPSHGGTFAIPSITVDTYGRVTSATTVNVTLPADSNTDTKVKQTSVASTTTTKYPVLMSYQNSPTSGQAYEARYNTGVTIGSGVLYGAAWNDYAEYREGTDTFEPGRVICENGDDTLSLATERLQPGANVVSDTFGFAIGETEKAKTPIAVSGRVLVYPYEDRNSYAPGDAVCAAPNGTVSKMTREEIREYPERIIGTVSAIPSYETWGEGDVPVNGRIWVKIK